MAAEIVSQHYSVDNTDSVLRVTSPSPQHWPSVVLSILMVSMGLYYTVAFIGMLALGYWPLDQRQVDTTMFNTCWAIWLPVWVVGTIIQFRRLLWLIAGKETAEIAGDKIVLSHHVSFFRKSKIYAATRVSNLRILQPQKQPWWRTTYDFGVYNAGRLGFDCDNKVICFADALDEAGAKHLVEAIRLRFPIYER